MESKFEHKEIVALWREFMSEKGRRHEIATIADLYPDIRSLMVGFSEVERFNPDLAQFFLENPIETVTAAEEAIQEIIPPEKKGVANVHFRIDRLPRDSRVEIRKIRAKHLGKFLSVEGLVRKATEVRPKLVAAKFQCARCGKDILLEQDGLHFQEPLECDKDQGGCGRGAGSTRFKLIVEESIFVDTQKIEAQESPEGLRGGAEPQRLVAFAEDDITGQISPGDRIVLNGVLKSIQKGSQQKSTLFDINLDLNSVEFEEHEYEEIMITPEEEQAIKDLASRPDIFRMVAESISPTIYGYDIEKESLALQLFGGIQKEMDDGTRIRGDIHILLVGDPGVAKTMILRYMADLAPRGIYASGKSSTAAGLTAAAVKDEFGEGRWTLEAGALVLADKGIACVDELDKMSPQDRSSIHESLEQQTVSVAKAGITATLQSRCAVLGAANPKYGRFDENRMIAEQIDLPPTLLTRFDVIFAMTDRPNAKEDTKVAKHILRAHRRGEARRYENIDQIQGVDGNMIMADADKLVPTIDRELLRKYVAFSKRTIPVLTDEAMKALEEYYVSIRSLGEAEGSSVPITARQLEALIRLSEASARARLSNIVTEDDASRSIRIVDYFLQKVASEGGRLDIDIIATGFSKSQVEHIQVLRRLIRDLSDPSMGVMESELLQRAESEGIPIEKAKAIIKKLSDAGELYSPRPGTFRLATEERA
ncbi:MAG TPA: minichromosome maintenance protein MCM [Euryarchaeota archaeon]|nr:minichromosome maintenance protein MCM [Euryarchaeota archaeon]